MKNPPSFQFYPQDFISDLNVQSMTDEECGRYIKLLCHCWIEDGLSVKGGSKMVDQWLKQDPTLMHCFIKKDGKYRNPRLDKERQKQINWHDKSVLGGRRSAENKRLGKGGSIKGQPKGNQPPTLPLQSSSSSLYKKDKKDKKEGEGVLPPIPKNFPFKVQDELRGMKAAIKEKERLLTEPERIKLKQTYDGRQLTVEILKEEIEAMKKEFMQKIEDYL